MADLTMFNPNAISNPNNNIFGLPFTEEDARLIILPVPWEVTVSYETGSARAPNHILRESLKVELLDEDMKDGWRQGFFMRIPDKKVLMKSDYLRKEAELYINYIAEGEHTEENKFMTKTLKEVNAGGVYLNEWVYEQTKDLLNKGKLVCVLGGDHSTMLGFLRAIAERHGDFGILQIDAHCDLRNTYTNFKYSHASVMYNALEEIPQITKLVQVGIRDFCEEEEQYLQAHPDRIKVFTDNRVNRRLLEGEIWKTIVDEVIEQLPQNVYISFDIDGLDPKLCPNTGSPVQGGLEISQAFYLCKKIVFSGRKLLGFDISEIGISRNGWDENVGARVLFKLCNLMLLGNTL
ncbi:agmatinase family protein [Ferruginibacter albus]|uniref:agmatinase family protein n=1 Tax=Ferruginibacter albus TaxID=2875540 RepID=UPI001CC33A69|nr:agmatinase family protein [Ferruginibacter albus]UAY50955.1 agmatinase family protein [Ferruginibacter albus]